MDLMKLRSVQWITIVGSVAGVLALLVNWSSTYRSIVIICTVGLCLATGVLEFQQDRFSPFVAGIRRYFVSFPVSQNLDILHTIEGEYRYLGVSFGSVLPSFRAWYGSGERRANVRIRIVITDPDATEALEFQACHERNIWKSKEEMNDGERKDIEEIVRRTRDSILLVLDSMATLQPGTPPIEVYFHRERIRKWMHIVNHNVLYMGMLPMGSDGLSAPVLQIQDQPGKWRLFKYYSEEWESVMRTARRVDLGRSAQPSR